MAAKIILTGSTGMVGEGVLLECLANPEITEVLMINRRHSSIRHAKLKELIVPDMFDLGAVADKLVGYNGCLFCAGISSVGMKEKEYHRITYELTVYFAETILSKNPGMIFSYVSGTGTDSSEQGKLMWARVKGKTENKLMRMPFKNVYNFRPGFMKPSPGQKNIKTFYKIVSALSPLFKLLMPSLMSTMQQVGQAMINSVLHGYTKQILEVKDIKLLAKVPS